MPHLQDPLGHVGHRDFQRIAKAIGYIEAHWREHPDLATLAGSVHLSPFHFERLFHRWAGVSPKSYIQHLTGSVAKAHLAATRKAGKPNLLETSLAVGLSGPSRLHDLVVKLEAMTPAEAAAGGEGCLLYTSDAADE